MLHVDFLCILDDYTHFFNSLTVKISSNEQAKNRQFTNPKYICILKIQNSKVGHGEWKIK